MIISELPKLKPLCYRIAFALLVLFILAGCSSIDPITKEVAWDVEQYGGNIDGFRFYISADVTLVNLDRNISTDNRQTVVREQRTRNEVRLTKKTSGRMQSGDIDTVLNVSFESRGGAFPTIAFIQSKGTGPTDRFYFYWQTDSRTNQRYIDYDGGRYEVSYKGNVEPYLQYERTEKERRRTRRMSGVR